MEWSVITWPGTWKSIALVGKTDSGKPNSNRRLHEVTKHASSEAQSFSVREDREESVEKAQENSLRNIPSAPKG